MTSDDNWTSGLGQRAGVLPPPPPDEDDDFEQPIVQRTVDAATAPSAVPRNAFHLPFLRPSSGATEETDDSAAEPQPEEKTMPGKKQTAPRKGPNLQLLILQQLTQVESMTSADLRAQLPQLEAQQLNQALFMTTKAGRAKKLKNKGELASWEITRAGRNYIGAAQADAPASAPASKRAARPTPGKKARRPSPASTAQFAAAPSTALAIRTFEPVVERSFRCAVFSDGAFNLKKNGMEIDLSPEEHREMLRYLDRMSAAEAS